MCMLVCVCVGVCMLVCGVCVCLCVLCAWKDLYNTVNMNTPVSIVFTKYVCTYVCTYADTLTYLSACTYVRIYVRTYTPPQYVYSGTSLLESSELQKPL